MNRKLQVLDLFSGIGGFSLGLERTGHYETAAFCEIDPYCQKVLRQHWPHVPIHSDIKELHYDQSIDVVTAGYPCQPFSVAGKQKGAADDRHLWPEVFRIIKQARPTLFLGENVANHIHLGLDEVLHDLKAKATPAGRLYFQLAPSKRHTVETECLWWPTPRAFMANAVKRINKAPRPYFNIEDLMGGNPNPEYVEWMMGFPAKWTETNL